MRADAANRGGIADVAASGSAAAEAAAPPARYLRDLGQKGTAYQGGFGPLGALGAIYSPQIRVGKTTAAYLALRISGGTLEGVEIELAMTLGKATTGTQVMNGARVVKDVELLNRNAVALNAQLPEFTQVADLAKLVRGFLPGCTTTDSELALTQSADRLSLSLVGTSGSTTHESCTLSLTRR